ncbi:hypothetical protein NAEGRDRAFT_56774 [Naegleria gruberi]|uniref:F-box domain-containing protein n=1 Tax=Naegleria gruberi TaxID=5762 RepID=D2V137_NAEGR|nr:uncharacterized protein NAEGRDRAFT_56774 [Naegleria gruberi]EFC49834.1 hypothetical protein NAEGRDRAFT_56774 [Naegleria gruberi]|eukprot:XP_002682578.1 hypothetical protein NAEGRDRAFT_56774 [Naegleria gruberi strain NEG-M]
MTTPELTNVHIEQLQHTIINQQEEQQSNTTTIIHNTSKFPSNNNNNIHHPPQQNQKSFFITNNEQQDDDDAFLLLPTTKSQEDPPILTTTTVNKNGGNQQHVKSGAGAADFCSTRDSVGSLSTHEAPSSIIMFEDESETENNGTTTTLSTSLVSACSTSGMMNMMMMNHMPSGNDINHEDEKEFDEMMMANRNDDQILLDDEEQQHGKLLNNNNRKNSDNNNGMLLDENNSRKNSDNNNEVKIQESTNQQQPRISIGDILKGLKATNPNSPINPSSSNKPTTPSSSVIGSNHSKDNSPSSSAPLISNNSNNSNDKSSIKQSPKKKNSDPVRPRKQSSDSNNSNSSQKRKKKSTTNDSEERSNPSHHRNPSEATSLMNADIDQSPHKRKLSLSVTIQNKISTWRSKHKKNVNSSSTDHVATTDRPPLLLLENNQQYSHLLSEKSQSADTFNTSISSMNSFVSNASEIDLKNPILKIIEKSPETPRKSSNPQISSLRNILATNRQRFYSSANDMTSQYSDASPMVFSPSSPFSEDKTKSPKVSLLNFSQIVPTLFEGPKSSRTHRGEKKTIFDNIKQEEAPKRKLSLPDKPEFLNSPKHNKKLQTQPANLTQDDIFTLSPPTPTVVIPNSSRHNSPKEPIKKLESLFCADTLLLICSFCKGGNQFFILREVCSTWHSFLDDDNVWRAMYLNYLENLIKSYWDTVGAYYGFSESHPKSGLQPKKKEGISIKYRLLNKRYKFLKALQKELTTAKPINFIPTAEPEIIHVRRGTIANFKQFENLETRRRTSSSTDRLTSPRFDDLSNFVGFGFQNPTSPPSSTAIPNLMSPRKHAHSTASLFDMKKAPVKKSKPPKQEQVEELSSKQIYLELVKDETRSRIQIGLKILQPVQLVKCLVDKEYSISRMTYFFFPQLYSPVAKFLSSAKSIIVGKLEVSEKNRFMTELFQHISVQFFSLFLMGLKALKTNLITNPIDYPEFYGELRKIMPSETAKCSNSTEAQFLADKLITKYFTLVVDRLNPEISFDVLSLFMDSFARIGKNKLLVLILEKAKEKFFDYETQLTPRLTKLVDHGRGKIKHKSAESDFLHFVINKIIPSAAMEEGDYRHIVDMLFDIMQTHYGIDNKQIASHFKKLTSTTTESIIDPHISIIKACFQNNGENTVALSFFDYLIDKFSIDMNRKEILFFLLENINMAPFLDYAKKMNKIDPKFVSRCFHSKHFAEFLLTQNPTIILDRLFTFFNMDPLADFENENSFKSIEEAWKSSISTGRNLIRSSGSFKNKDNFLKIISKIEIRNNEPKPVYSLDILQIYKLLCTRFREQDKKFNLQKIDRDLNIGVNLITHVFVKDFIDRPESLYEICDLLINHSNVLIDCKILKLILMKSELVEKQTGYSSLLPNILDNASKALELILNNSAMIIPKNPNSSMKSSMHGSDIIGYSEWYLNYKLTNDPAPLVEEYIQLFERTQAFIERNRLYGNTSNFGCFSCCYMQ